MRVAILSPFLTKPMSEWLAGDAGLPLGMGGYCTVTYVQERLKRNMPTDVITLDQNVEHDIQLWDRGLFRLWVVRHRKGHVLRDVYKEERRLLSQAIMESNADVLHAHWTYEYALAAISQRKTPCLVTVHDHARNIFRRYPCSYLIKFLITQYVFRHHTLFSAVSPYVSEYIQCCNPKAEVQVIPNIPPYDLAQKMTSVVEGEHAKKTIVSVVSWSSLKNVKRALRAFSQVFRPGCRLEYRLIGPGLEYGGSAWKWAKSHKLLAGVSFLGRLPYSECLREIQSSTILFHPSLEESFGCTVAEALMFQKPVVATTQAVGVGWLISDGGRYVLLADGTSDLALGKALQEMLERAHGRVFAQWKVINRCCPESIVGSYNCLYEKASFLNSKQN